MNDTADVCGADCCGAAIRNNNGAVDCNSNLWCCAANWMLCMQILESVAESCRLVVHVAVQIRSGRLIRDGNVL